MATAKRAPYWKLQLPGDKTAHDKLSASFETVKKTISGSLNRPVNNADVLETLLDMFTAESTGPTVSAAQSEITKHKASTTSLIVTCQSSLDKLLELSHDHGRYCRSPLHIGKINKSGHVSMIKLDCKNEKKHSFHWNTSPKMPKTGMFFINEQIAHGLLLSGMRPIHYTRFVTGCKLGVMGEQYRREFLNAYRGPVKDIYTADIQVVTKIICHVSQKSCHISFENQYFSKIQPPNIDFRSRYDAFSETYHYFVTLCTGCHGS